MPIFKYAIRDKEGRWTKGLVEGEDRSSVVLKFQASGYKLVNVQNATAWDLTVKNFQEQVQIVPRESIVMFTRQLSTMVRSGLPLARTLEVLKEQERNPRFRQAIESIGADIENGKPLSLALARYPHLFPQLYVGMVEGGEAIGLLSEVLDRLTALGMQDIDFRAKIRAALTYPIILTVVAFGVVAFLLVGALPKFVDIFEAGNVQLPLPTLILLGVSVTIRSYWYLLLVAIAGAVYGLHRFRQSERGKRFFDEFIFKIPRVGDVYLKIQIARLTRSLSSLTKSGIPILKGLGIVKGMVTNQTIANSLEEIRVGVSQGKDLTGLFRTSGLFPPLVSQMISVGENTGKIDQTLSDIANFYDDEIGYFLKNLAASLEPLLLLMMGGMVGFIALAVLMPIFQMVKVFH